MKRNIIELAEAYIRDHGMIQREDVVVAGVSGGADSVCLLFVLCALRERLGFRVKVCHVNHGLRGAEADADEAYVRELCGRLGVECRFFHENVELVAKKRKQSCEEAGRGIRREAFEKMCRENGATKIATAHHRDDNVETVLMNMARGTGVQGLCGIWPVRGRWIRPLLCLGREQIERFLKERGVGWRTDVTNGEETYTRNRIRLSIVPQICRQVNPGAVRHLDELSCQVREIWEYLEYETQKAWERCVRVCDRGPDEKGLAIDAFSFAAEAPAVQKQLIKKCLAAARGAEKDIGSAHILAALALFDRQAGKRLDLGGGVTARRTYDGVFVGREKKGSAGRAGAGGGAPGRGAERGDAGSVGLTVPGKTRLPGEDTVIECRFINEGGVEKARKIPQKSYTKWIDYDIIKHSLSMRTRQSGDYLTVDAEGGRQKLKDFLINRKVPREMRDRLMLIADGKHIVWIPGLRMSRAYQVGQDTKKILEIKITEEKENVRDDQSADPGRKSRREDQRTGKTDQQ